MESKKIVIEGEGLVSVNSIVWAGYECAISTQDETSVEC